MSYTINILVINCNISTEKKQNKIKRHLFVIYADFFILLQPKFQSIWYSNTTF